MSKLIQELLKRRGISTEEHNQGAGEGGDDAGAMNTPGAVDDSKIGGGPDDNGAAAAAGETGQGTAGAGEGGEGGDGTGTGTGEDQQEEEEEEEDDEDDEDDFDEEATFESLEEAISEVGAVVGAQEALVRLSETVGSTIEHGGMSDVEVASVTEAANLIIENIGDEPILISSVECFQEFTSRRVHTEITMEGLADRAVSLGKKIAEILAKIAQRLKEAMFGFGEATKAIDKLIAELKGKKVVEKVYWSGTMAEQCQFVKGFKYSPSKNPELVKEFGLLFADNQELLKHVDSLATGHFKILDRKASPATHIASSAEEGEEYSEVTYSSTGSERDLDPIATLTKLREECVDISRNAAKYTQNGGKLEAALERLDAEDQRQALSDVQYASSRINRNSLLMGRLKAMVINSSRSAFRELDLDK